MTQRSKNLILISFYLDPLTGYREKGWHLPDSLILWLANCVHFKVHFWTTSERRADITFTKPGCCVTTVTVYIFVYVCWICCRVASIKGSQHPVETSRSKDIALWAEAVGVANSWPWCRMWPYCCRIGTDYDAFNCRKLQRSGRSQRLSRLCNDHSVSGRFKPHQSTTREPILSANCRSSVWHKTNRTQCSNIQRQPISHCWICTSCHWAVPSVYQVCSVSLDGFISWLNLSFELQF